MGVSGVHVGMPTRDSAERPPPAPPSTISRWRWRSTATDEPAPGGGGFQAGSMKPQVGVASSVNCHTSFSASPPYTIILSAEASYAAMGRTRFGGGVPATGSNDQAGAPASVSCHTAWSVAAVPSKTRARSRTGSYTTAGMLNKGGLPVVESAIQATGFDSSSAETPEAPNVSSRRLIGSRIVARRAAGAPVGAAILDHVGSDSVLSAHRAEASYVRAREVSGSSTNGGSFCGRGAPITSLHGPGGPS